MLKFKNTYNSTVTIPKQKDFNFFELLLCRKINISFFLLLIFIQSACEAQSEISVGANQTKGYFSLLTNKRVAVVANQTSVIFKDYKQSSYTHLVDSLLSRNITISKVFSPEHGFRGKADAAEHVANGVDTKTGLPIISLYGKNKKPTKEQVKNIDIVVFDIQDVGVRFYTYISTLHYVMEACAENNIPVLVLDRPNPNGHYVDGPMLDLKHRSFVGMHAVPLVYGMTIGEYAKMINGEHWLKNNVTCDLIVIPLKNYNHQKEYNLPIRPSPNLPNSKSINLYPSLGFFEGTPINAGRGTEFQFQRYGSSKFPNTLFAYFPVANFGSKYPKDQNKKCYGYDLTKTKKLSKVDISFLINAYQNYPNKKEFFGKTFTIHAGNTKLQSQLENRLTAKEIEDSWKKEIHKFIKIRKKYITYP